MGDGYIVGRNAVTLENSCKWYLGSSSHSAAINEFTWTAILHAVDHTRPIMKVSCRTVAL